MKSIEEIQRRIEDVKQFPEDFRTNTELNYLDLAIKSYNEPYWMKHLVRKYSFDNEENEIIIRTLKWVLEDEI